MKYIVELVIATCLAVFIVLFGCCAVITNDRSLIIATLLLSLAEFIYVWAVLFVGKNHPTGDS